MRLGKISENVLKRSVLRQLKSKRQEITKGAGIGEDCALFAFSEGEYLVTSIQEGASLPCEEPDDTDWIERTITKCINNLVVGGGEPVGISLTLILPEEAEEAMLKSLMKRADAVCAAQGIAIATGQTSVSSFVTRPIGTVCGYAKAAGESALSPRKAKPGQAVLLSKWIGLEGTAILAKTSREKLLCRYPAYLVDAAAGFNAYLSIAPEAATAIKSGVCAMHDASEGGILGALRELAEGAGVGLTIDLKKIPLRQETVEVCEVCNANPYELLSGGCLVMTAEDGDALVLALEEQGIPATVIGRVTDGKERILLNGEEVRYLDKAQQDSIYKEEK